MLKQKTKETCSEMIQKLNVSEKIKNSLHTVRQVAASKNANIKSSVKHLFISSPLCKELSKIAKCYERIIISNGVYPVHGARTYLELAFPSEKNEKEYKAFFASPKLAAATLDYFTGVFLISFEQWKGARDLIEEPAFMDLVKFIDDNKGRISFVFHVTPEFKDKKVLMNELNKYVNLYCLEHALPDFDTSLQFVEMKLREAGIKFDQDGREGLKQLLENKVDVTAASYMGYLTLEKFIENLQFELYAQESIYKKTVKKRGEKLVGKKEILMASDYISVPDETITYKRKVGFN